MGRVAAAPEWAGERPLSSDRCIKADEPLSAALVDRFGMDERQPTGLANVVWWPTMGASLRLFVKFQNLRHFSGKRVNKEWLGEQFHPGLQMPISNRGILRVAGNK